MTDYFARVTAGLEQVAWDDIARRSAAALEGFGHRRIDFAFDGSPADLLALRSVDDVYVTVARLAGLDRTRVTLKRLARDVEALDFGPALATIVAVRNLPAVSSCRVTSSHLGKRNYSRYDIESALADVVTNHFGWRFVLNAPGESEPDLDLRILLEDDWALLGLRLGDTPLHRRPYKMASQPGSLKAPVAYCLGLLSGIGEGAAVLDLACGAGTILAEAAALAPGGALIGIDTQPEAIDLADLNLAAAGLHPDLADAAALAQPFAGRTLLVQADATQIVLPAQQFDAVVSNLPWGAQVADIDALPALYAGFLRAAAHALKLAARAVLLTDQSDILRAALAEHPELVERETFSISLFGRHPTVFVLERR